MPGITTNDNVQQQQTTTDEKPKSSEQIDLEEAENALNAKDYKTARGLLEKLGKRFFCDGIIGERIDLFVDWIVKLQTKSEDEESIRIKESAVLTLGKLFKETKDAKGMKNSFLDRENKFVFC